MPNIDVKASVNFWLACIATWCPTQKTSFDIDAHRSLGDMIGVLSSQMNRTALNKMARLFVSRCGTSIHPRLGKSMS